MLRFSEKLGRKDLEKIYLITRRNLRVKEKEMREKKRLKKEQGGLKTSNLHLLLLHRGWGEPYQPADVDQARPAIAPFHPV